MGSYIYRYWMCCTPGCICPFHPKSIQDIKEKWEGECILESLVTQDSHLACGPALSLLSYIITVTQFKASFPNTSQKLRTFLLNGGLASDKYYLSKELCQTSVLSSACVPTTTCGRKRCYHLLLKLFTLPTCRMTLLSTAADSVKC